MQKIRTRRFKHTSGDGSSNDFFKPGTIAGRYGDRSYETGTKRIGIQETQLWTNVNGSLKYLLVSRKFLTAGHC